MICNISRAKGIMECRQKEWNFIEKRLVPRRDAEPLMTGGSYHDGVAVLFAGGQVEAAVQAAKDSYAKALEGQVILEAEKPILHREIFIATKAVELYAKYYKDEPYQVLMPEVEFCVPIPNTLHHCWFTHRLLYPNIPYDACRVTLCGEPHNCWQPHRLKGRTDALIEWHKMLWFLEHKTSAAAQKVWWDQWFLDLQITGYTYGIWKALNLRPQGAVLNKIQKPRSNESLSTWALREDLFQRDPILRTDEDLERFEKQFTFLCNDYEDAFRLGHIYMNPASCLNYNRHCYYWDMCKKHKEDEPAKFRKRPRDYVEEEYYKVLGLPLPEEKEEETPKPEPFDINSIFPKE